MEETKIISDVRNELLKRREARLVLNGEKNPGFAVAKELAATQLGVAHDCVAVKFLRNNFGRNKFMAEVFVYDSADDLIKIEPKIKKKKVMGK